MRCGRVRAFTLTEVIVVIAIISMLAALGMSVYTTSREKSRQSVCLNNLHQLGLSLATYLQDNDEAFPAGGVWDDWRQTHPQLQGCPSVSLSEREERTPRGIPGYAYNDSFCDPRDGNTIRLSEVVHPTVTVFFCDEANGVTGTISPDPSALIRPYPYGQEEGWKRHFGGGNYCFADGHAHWYTPEGVDACNSAIGNTGEKPTFCYRGPQPPPFPLK